MPDLTLVPRRSIAGIISFRDQDQLHAALLALFGTAPPGTASFVQAGATTLARLSPTRFLATADAGADLPARLAVTLKDVAAVTDQSDMWVAWRVSGAGVRDWLGRIVPVDLAPDAFRVGDLALTRSGHLDVRLFRVDTDDYEIATSRSLSQDLLHDLEESKKGLLF